jgi:hypothetical protein
MDVDIREADKLETGIAGMSSFTEMDPSIAATCNAAEAFAPMPASSSWHTEQQKCQTVPADAETQADEELSDEEAGTDDEEKNANNTTYRHVKNAAADRKVDKRFNELTSVIAAHQKHLRNKKSMLTDAKAAGTILDLEALQQFNQIQHKLHLEIRERRIKLAEASPKTRRMLQMKMRPIQPATDASERVAELRSKSKTYARRLREHARHLLRTGELLENNQGKGAHHESHLSRPSVVHALRRWVNGLVPSEEGGFEGQVCRHI